MIKSEVLFVDGYNMIGYWPELRILKKQDQLGNARDLLLHELSNYAKYKNIEIRVVFDAQFVPGITQQYDQYALQVIFTKEGETADSYIERKVGEENYLLTNVTVATSDLAEQWMIFQKGATRKSANELWKDLRHAKKNINMDVKSYRLTDHRRNSPYKPQDVERLQELYWEMVNNHKSKK